MLDLIANWQDSPMLLAGAMLFSFWVTASVVR